jgi:uncharacterized repeat protein (TIGR03803 family)
VFSYNPKGSGTFTVLYKFKGPSFDDGEGPSGQLAMDSSGDIFGTTNLGGANVCSCGTIFELTSSGSGYIESVVHSFAGGGSDGANPENGVTRVATGPLYGTTQGGGDNKCTLGRCGTVFKLAPSTGSYSVVANFSAAPKSGQAPQPSGLYSENGMLYGTTTYGGTCKQPSSSGTGCGTVFSVDKSSGILSTLYVFQGAPHDGSEPQDAIGYSYSGGDLTASGTVLYGATYYGGSGCSPYAGCGTIFSIPEPTPPSNLRMSVIERHM